MVVGTTLQTLSQPCCTCSLSFKIPLRTFAHVHPQAALAVTLASGLHAALHVVNVTCTSIVLLAEEHVLPLVSLRLVHQAKFLEKRSPRIIIMLLLLCVRLVSLVCRAWVVVARYIVTGTIVPLQQGCQDLVLHWLASARPARRCSCSSLLPAGGTGNDKGGMTQEATGRVSFRCNEHPSREITHDRCCTRSEAWVLETTLNGKQLGAKAPQHSPQDQGQTIARRAQQSTDLDTDADAQRTANRNEPQNAAEPSLMPLSPPSTQSRPGNPSAVLKLARELLQ